MHTRTRAHTHTHVRTHTHTHTHTHIIYNRLCDFPVLIVFWAVANIALCVHWYYLQLFAIMQPVNLSIGGFSAAWDTLNAVLPSGSQTLYYTPLLTMPSVILWVSSIGIRSVCYEKCHMGLSLVKNIHWSTTVVVYIIIHILIYFGQFNIYFMFYPRCP